MSRPADKAALISQLRAALTRDLDAARARARDASDAATHEENRAESDKDMRATESSYIARGHSQRVSELETALSMLGVLPLRDFHGGVPIAVSALVTLAHEGVETVYLLVPAGGGVVLDGAVSLATKSPLGAAMLRACEGDELVFGKKTYDIVDVR